MHSSHHARIFTQAQSLPDAEDTGRPPKDIAGLHIVGLIAAVHIIFHHVYTDPALRDGREIQTSGSVWGYAYSCACTHTLI